MGRATVVLDRKGVEKLLRSDKVRGEIEERAKKVLARALADAPVVTGNYRASLHIETDITDRVRVRVVADAPHSHLVEAQSGVLSRALDEASG